MRVKSRASLLCLASLLVFATTAAQADVEVQFFDGNGVLQTDRAVDVQVFDNIGGASARMTLPPSPDGTYTVPVEEGMKVGFYVAPGTEQMLGGISEVLLKIPTGITGPLPITVLGGPANDDCANAQAIGALPQNVAGTTVGASQSPEAGAVCGTTIDAGTPGVWYTVTGTGTQLSASTCNDANPDGSADYDTKISVYCQDCEDPPVCVAGNDDGPGCAGFSSLISWCSEAGATYRIYVHGFFGDTGNFTLNVTDSGATCNPSVSCLPPPPSGACCNCLPNAPFNCTQGTPEECATAFGGEYQGDDSECVVPAPGGFDYVANPGVAIPDNNPAGVTDSLNVPDSFFVADLNVDIGITHTWISDLIITITHDDTSISQELWSQQCGSGDNIMSTADDEGTTLTCAQISGGPIDSIFWPPAIGGQGPLSIFDGINANGSWSFNVSDNFAADTGSIMQWSLHFLGGQPLCVTGDDDDDNQGGCFDCAPEADGKVTICHVPPGNPGNAHTIRVSPSALPAHCGNHGDSCGECDLDVQTWEGFETTGETTGPISDRPADTQQDNDRRDRTNRIPRR